MFRKEIHKIIFWNALAWTSIALIYWCVELSRKNRYAKIKSSSIYGNVDSIMIDVKEVEYYRFTNGDWLEDEFLPYRISKIINKGDTIIKYSNSNILEIHKKDYIVERLELSIH